jgi:hypothetical protein
MTKWIKIEDLKEDQLTNEIKFIGFNKDWIDEDFNPDGTRECFPTDGASSGWCSAKCIDYHDTYASVYDTKPTHVAFMPSTIELKNL